MELLYYMESWLCLIRAARLKTAEEGKGESHLMIMLSISLSKSDNQVIVSLAKMAIVEVKN